MTTFVQLSARLKNFLRGWLLVLGLKESLVEFAIVCVKSVVILIRSMSSMTSITSITLRTLSRLESLNSRAKALKRPIDGTGDVGSIEGVGGIEGVGRLE